MESLKINKKKCLACGGCPPLCKPHALMIDRSHLIYNSDKCTLCKNCVLICPVEGVVLREED